MKQQAKRKLPVAPSGDARPLRTRYSPSPRRNLKVVQDRRLVEKCLAGETSAWSNLYVQFHDALLTGIRAFLGQAGQDSNLVEEIAARVWYSLVKDDFELLGKFDARRGCRLSTFLSLVAKNEARLLLRSERRRKSRELAASRQEGEAPCQNGSIGWLSDEEFIVTLSPAERSFYFDVLVAEKSQSAAPEYSRQNQWQLRHRIRKKLERYISQAS